MLGQHVFVESFLFFSMVFSHSTMPESSQDAEVIRALEKNTTTCVSLGMATNLSWSVHCTTTAPPTQLLVSLPSNRSLENDMKELLNRSPETVNISTRSRVRFCNVPDDDEQMNNTSTTSRRVRRYSLHGKKWEKTELTWTLRTPSRRIDRLPEGVIRQQLYAAMKVWERESAITFKEVHKDTPEVDIYIDFLEGDHKDGYKFDGPGGTLAHAFYPGQGQGGDMHFDDAENFVAHYQVKKYESNSLLVTAAHELGHSLGLRHSEVATALMAPFYQEYPEDFKLPNDDRYGIQALYGRPQTVTTVTTRPPATTSSPATTPYKPPVTPYGPSTTPTTFKPPTTKRPPTTTQRPTYRPPPIPPTKPVFRPTTKAPIPPTTTPFPDITSTPTPLPCPAVPPPIDLPDTCNTDFDAVTRYHEEFYFFKGKFYWRVSKRGHLHSNEFPNQIWYRFSGLPRDLKHIDAVYISRKDTFVFFSGSMYYELGSTYRIQNTGKLVDLGVNASHLDAAMVWGHNGRIYMFSGDHYWRLDRDGHAEPDYPRDIAVWRGLPRNYSAAFTVRTVTYFVAGRVFWSFDNLKMKILEPPSLIAPYWLSCPHHNPQKLFRCSPASVAGTLSSVSSSLHVHTFLRLTVLCVILRYLAVLCLQ
ncbi:stromelysin-3 [Cherax quadricarinatus]|uniref:stromelysin-3 n=1 Tax=Cherax quadricarinatus TaxID=27406 RepID=UPI0023783B81|nr:matrix metalloproteinase-2-like [Cherax quadricarinatus]